MASYGQARPQAPQSMQIFGSMKYSAFLTPVIAVTGHTSSQALQPTHLSVMKKDTARAPRRSVATNSQGETHRVYQDGQPGKVNPGTSTQQGQRASGLDRDCSS